MATGEERTGPFVDPRCGDLEDDLSSTKQHSMFSLLGGLLVEVSLVKLAFAWILLLVLPGLALGLGPIAASAWVTAVADRIFTPFSGVIPLLVLAVFVAVGLYGARALLRFAENGFWSLTSVVVQPVYVACRETLRHFTERLLPRSTSPRTLALLRAATAAVSGLVICGLALLIMFAVWPATDLFNGIREIGSLGQLARVGAGQQRHAGCRLPGRRGPAVGHRRHDDGATGAISAASPRRRLTQGAGGSFTSRTSTSSASATAFASKAADPDQAAMSG